MDYATLLALHKFTVVMSLTLFLLRSAWRMMDSPMMNKKWVKIVPHANDALLLAAAIGMLVVSGLNPLEHDWLMAKILALFLYIALGMVVLKWGQSRRMRTLAFVGALAVFGYIVAVAMTKQVIPL